MTEIEMKQIETNISKMIADVDLGNRSHDLSQKDHELNQKKFTIEIIKLVLYGVAVGAASVIAAVKILG
ncbi:MAG: hypothetical protein Q9M19_03510 [Mariprofundaceae bacterium]|nr:hypothetical protein [Mariprofundaceae bacterium]